jgi:3',5'-cyclic AMP phosphodiesterase CpdA
VHISKDEDKDSRLQRLIRDLNSEIFPKTKGLVLTGDVVSKVYSDKENGRHLESSNNLLKLMSMLGNLIIPHYLVMGNHDYKIDGEKDSDAPFSKAEIDTMEKIWRNYTLFRPYYSITFHGWNLIMLNSMRGRYLTRNFDDEQMGWFENELKKGLPVILFFHHPIRTDHFKLWCKPKDLITDENEPRFFELCAEYKEQIKAVFVGHGHRWVEDTLYETIPVFETDSFADRDGLPFYLVGLDTVQLHLDVQRTPHFY